METVTATAELGGVAVFALLVLALVRPCLEAERYLARRRAGYTRGDVANGYGRYVRTDAGRLLVRPGHKRTAA